MAKYPLVFARKIYPLHTKGRRANIFAIGVTIILAIIGSSWWKTNQVNREVKSTQKKVLLVEAKNFENQGGIDELKKKLDSIPDQILKIARDESNRVENNMIVRLDAVIDGLLKRVNELEHENKSRFRDNQTNSNLMNNDLSEVWNYVFELNKNNITPLLKSLEAAYASSNANLILLRLEKLFGYLQDRQMDINSFSWQLEGDWLLKRIEKEFGQFIKITEIINKIRGLK